MNIRLMPICVIVLAMLVSTDGAEPYWYAYEGTDYPENEGWSQDSEEPFADRWLEDGALVIDASESGRTLESYRQYPATAAPEAGEIFVMQWRLNVEM